MLKDTCEWNSFVIFHENITFWTWFRPGLNAIWMDVYLDSPLNLGLILSKVLAYIAYSCCSMCAIVAHMRLPFFKKQKQIVSRIGLAYQWKIIISSAANYLTVARKHKMDPWSAPKMTKHNKIRRVIAILTLSHFLAEVIQTVNILHRI